ncbi:MAG: FAD-dependent oxidoreductase [Candidatus Riflebacteria bacterium]|nr:FAD-dependent oxidoreductase [Candidatus Riflebacteria bacterium]
MELGEPDGSGRRRPVPVPGSEHTLATNVVIRALGQRLDEHLAAGLGLRVEKGLVAVDPATGQTSHPKVFAGGDSINGGQTVVDAVAHGKKAAAAIDRLLNG